MRLDCNNTQSAAPLDDSDRWTVSCDNKLAERYLHLLLRYDQKDTSPTRGAPCSVEDLVAGFYYRTLQIEMPVIHTCKLGYCKASWNSPCKRNLPATEIEPQLRFDNNVGRAVAQKRHLDDDARVLTHSVPLLARTLMNIQINQHHPEDAHGALNYQVKYNLKPEPQTVVQLGCASEHEAVRYLKGQFLSVSAAAAFVLEDPVTECTRNVSPLAFPSWRVGDTEVVQGHVALANLEVMILLCFIHAAVLNCEFVWLRSSNTICLPCTVSCLCYAFEFKIANLFDVC